MKAIDTNVVVRWLVRDDARQAEIADGVVVGGVYVPHTVLVEVVWVLRSVYRYDRTQIADALSMCLKAETVVIDERRTVLWAIERYARGGDFADLLHVAVSGESEAFVTFDRDIARHAGENAPVPIETLG